MTCKTTRSVAGQSRSYKEDLNPRSALIDVDDVAPGHQTRMRWNDPDAWIWSDTIVHEPLIGTDQFQTVRDHLAAGRREVDRKP